MEQVRNEVITTRMGDFSKQADVSKHWRQNIQPLIHSDNGSGQVQEKDPFHGLMVCGLST